MKKPWLFLFLILATAPVWTQSSGTEDEKEGSGTEITSGGGDVGSGGGDITGDTGNSGDLGDTATGGDTGSGADGGTGTSGGGTGNGNVPSVPEASFVVQNNDTVPVIQLYLSTRPQGRVLETPYLRIYGNGTLRVQRPGANRSSDRSIDREQINKLVAMLSRKGLMDFDEAAALAIKERLQIEASSRPPTTEEEAAEVYFDDTTTVIEINLETYTPVGSRRDIHNFHKRISWEGLSSDARKYPSFRAVQYLSEAVNDLVEASAK